MSAGPTQTNITDGPCESSLTTENQDAIYSFIYVRLALPGRIDVMCPICDMYNGPYTIF